MTRKTKGRVGCMDGEVEGARDVPVLRGAHATAMTDAGVQPAPQERTQLGQDRNRIISLSVPRHKRPGTLFYGASRSPAEVIHYLTEALRREIRVSDGLGIPESNDTLRDIISWGERGAISS